MKREYSPGVILALVGLVLVGIIALIFNLGVWASRSRPTTSTPPTMPPWPFPTDTETPEIEPIPNLPIKKATIRDGKPYTLKGTKPMQIEYRIVGPAKLIVALDCSKCTGEVLFTTVGRKRPWISSPKPVSGEFLENVFPEDRDGILVIRAKGKWTARLTSWADLKPLKGPQKGHGGKVLLIDETAGHIRVVATPANAGDTLWVRTYPLSRPDGGIIFGTETAEPYDQTHALEFPAIIAIDIEGPWEVIPLP